MNRNTIREWPEEDRPREKLLRSGEHTLSNSELLAILLRTGTRGSSALELGRAILARFGSFRGMAHTDPAAWRAFSGLGPAKIAQIKAAVEIGRRFTEEEIRSPSRRVRSSAEVARMFMPRMRDLKKEVFKAVMLNARNRIIDVAEITQGTVNQANPVIREIFQEALQRFASAVICLHNHPSGSVIPSPEDKHFTRELAAAGRYLQIAVLDHIIIGDNAYFSFADEGLLS